MARAGQGTSAVGIEVQGNASREATFKPPVQAAAEAGENFSRIQFATLSFGFVSGHDFSRAVNEL